MRTAGRPAARERSAVSPSTSIAARGRRVALGKRGRYARIIGAQGGAPLFRSAITFAALRALAAGIRTSTCTAAEARFAERPDSLGPPTRASIAQLTRLLLSTRVIWLRTVVRSCI